MFPLESIAICPGEYSSALVAAEPSPENPCVLLPAMVDIVYCCAHVLM
jgi:hypothetical protein